MTPTGHHHPPVPLVDGGEPPREPTVRRTLSYTCAMVGVVIVVIVVALSLVLSHLMSWGHDNPEVLRALRHDPMASYRPAHVIRTVVDVERDAGTVLEETNDAEILRVYVIPRDQAAQYMADAAAAARAAGWKLEGDIEALRRSRLPSRFVSRDGSAFPGDVVGEKRRANGTVATFGIQLQSENPYPEGNNPDPIPLRRDQMLFTTDLDSGWAGEGERYAVPVPPSNPPTTP